MYFYRQKSPVAWLALMGAIGMTLATGACGSTDETYRYKMTLEVETPQGLKTGSAVREITYARNWIKLPEGSPVRVTQRGEAVSVDLPNGQALFALLSEDGYKTMQAGFGGLNGDDSAKNLDDAKTDGMARELNPLSSSPRVQSGYPILVRFRNMHDPKSVEVVSRDDLSSSFGAGVRLKRITVQMVSGEVTIGIEEKLKWLPVIYKMGIGPDFHPAGIPVENFRGLFTSE